MSRLQRKFSGIHATLVQQQAYSAVAVAGEATATSAVPSASGMAAIRTAPASTAATGNGNGARAEYEPEAADFPVIAGGRKLSSGGGGGALMGHHIADLDANMMSLTDRWGIQNFSVFIGKIEVWEECPTRHCPR